MPLPTDTTKLTTNATLEKMNRDAYTFIVEHHPLKQAPCYGIKVFPVAQNTFLFPQNLVRHRSVTHMTPAFIADLQGMSLWI